jgi:hypothetical protein
MLLCLALATLTASAVAADGLVRFAASRARQPDAEMPVLKPPTEKSGLADPPAVGDKDLEDVPVEQVLRPAASARETDPFQYAATRGSGIPSSPYIAGLSYMMTPQPFRVPYPNRFYYPSPHFVHRCPYYPRGYYWGANWNVRFLPANNLIHGHFRFNPYLSRLKTGANAGGKQQCVPLAPPEMPAFATASVDVTPAREQPAERSFSRQWDADQRSADASSTELAKSSTQPRAQPAKTSRHATAAAE